jgi:hypothetical protein
MPRSFIRFGQHYEVTEATCWLDDSGGLSVEASGTQCDLRAVRLPFPDAESMPLLAGREWDPDPSEFDKHADCFAEGHVLIAGEEFHVYQARVACRFWDDDAETLEIEMQLEGETARGRVQGEVDVALEARRAKPSWRRT